MMARVAFLVALLIVIITILLSRTPKKEALNLTPPSGYAMAQPIEKPKEETFVSALEYAQAFARPEEAITEAKVVAPPVVAKAKKALPKRQIARSKNKKLQNRKSKLVARW